MYTLLTAMPRVAVVLIAQFIPLVLSLHHEGLDTSDACNATCMRCMAFHSHKFFIGRVWRASGDFDEVNIGNIQEALKYGLGEFYCWNNVYFMVIVDGADS